MIADKLITLMEQHEGVRHTVYRCTGGKLTIGVGHNLEDNPVSDTVIRLLLEEDIGHCVRELCSIFPMFHSYGDARQAALISMMFMGAGSFRGFKRMIEAIQASDWEKASVEALDSQWARQVKSRANEIAVMLLNNTWSEAV